MYKYPKMPKGQVLDLLDNFEQELVAWRATADLSSRYNDNGTLRYRQYWLEYLPPIPPYMTGSLEATAEVARFRVDAAQRDRIIRAKALEKALERMGVKL